MTGDQRGSNRGPITDIDAPHMPCGECGGTKRRVRQREHRCGITCRGCGFTFLTTIPSGATVHPTAVVDDDEINDGLVVD